MITLQSGGYKTQDYEFLLHYFLSNPVCTQKEPICQNCKHRIACSDITRLIDYVSRKVESK